MKFQILFVLSAVLICSEATYYGALGRYGMGGLGYGYGAAGLGGLGYGAAGLGGYNYQLLGKPAVAAYSALPSIPAVQYNGLPLGKSVAALEVDPYVVYDSAAVAPYSLLDGTYGAGIYSNSLRYGLPLKK